MGDEKAGDVPVVEEGRWWRRRPVVVYGFVVAVFIGLGYSFVADMLVNRHIEALERDAETGIIAGFEPIELGNKAGKRAVLMVHGFIGAPDCFGELPKVVADEGWYVHSMLVEGHGTSPRDFEKTSAEDMLAGVKAELARLQAEYETVVVVGHSMGGALSTLAVSELGADGLVLVAPFFGLSVPAPMGLIRVAARVAAPAVRWAPSRPGGAPVAKRENRSKVNHYHWIPMQGVLAALEVERQANDAAVLEGVTCPVLLLHSKKDRVTSPKASQKAFDKLGSGDKSKVIYERSNHVLHWDYDAEAANEEVAKFLGGI